MRRPTRPARVRATVTVVAGLLLAACGTGSVDDLQGWIGQQRARVQPEVEAMPEPRPFQAQPYAGGSATDPFSLQRLAQALRQDESLAAATSDLVAPEINRRKEALESYPLDTMTMVGTLSRRGRLVALVTVENRLYTVAPGQYLGQNFGKVMRVTPTELVLREIVRDPGGTWSERQAQLQIQERTK